VQNKEAQYHDAQDKHSRDVRIARLAPPGIIGSNVTERAGPGGTGQILDKQK
jgi:hypothetical protein